MTELQMTYDAVEADLWVAQLRAHGIEGCISGPGASPGMGAFRQAVVIFVPEDQLDQAREILSAPSDDPISDADLEQLALASQEPNAAATPESAFAFLGQIPLLRSLPAGMRPAAVLIGIAGAVALGLLFYGQNPAALNCSNLGYQVQANAARCHIRWDDCADGVARSFECAQVQGQWQCDCREERDGSHSLTRHTTDWICPPTLQQSQLKLAMRTCGWP